MHLNRPKRRKPPPSAAAGASSSSGATKDQPKSTKPPRSAAAAHALQSALLKPSSGMEAHAAMRRRSRTTDPDAVVQIKVPAPPLPSAWGWVVRPYGAPLHFQQQITATVQQVTVQGATQPQQVAQHQQQQQQQLVTTGSKPAYHCTADLCKFDFGQLQRREFLGVMINTGWEREPGQAAAGGAQQQQQQQRQQQQLSNSAATTGSPAGAAPAVDGGSSLAATRAQVVRRLAALPLPTLCPRGFVFVWARKQHLSAIVSQLYSWGFAYVENLTWVWKQPNNTVARLPHAFTASSHLTLLIFRREGQGRDIELRHQRSPDVVFDCIAPAPGREWRVPQEVYSTLETLLPTGGGAFLELWAAAEHARPGWTHVAEAAAAAADGPSG